MHYKQISKGHFEWVNVGSFFDDNMELRMEGMKCELFIYFYLLELIQVFFFRVTISI